MNTPCVQYGSNPGYAARMNWLEARDFCRRLTDIHRDQIEALGPHLSVNLPTFKQWESMIACVDGDMVVRGLPSPPGVSEEPAHIESIATTTESFVFADKFYEFCLDGAIDDHNNLTVGMLASPREDGSIPVSMNRSDDNLLSVSCGAAGAMLPHLRDVRGLWIDTAIGALALHRLYTGPPFSEYQPRGPSLGFRIAIHSIANGTASASSPTVDISMWGRVAVDGCGSFTNAKIFPGGARNWDFFETKTRPDAGIDVADVMELLEWGSKTIVIGSGYREEMRVTEELRDFLTQREVPFATLNTKDAVATYNRIAASGTAVGALIYTSEPRWQ